MKGTKWKPIENAVSILFLVENIPDPLFKHPQIVLAHLLIISDTQSTGCRVEPFLGESFTDNFCTRIPSSCLMASWGTQGFDDSMTKSILLSIATLWGALNAWMRISANGAHYSGSPHRLILVFSAIDLWCWTVSCSPQKSCFPTHLSF